MGNQSMSDRDDVVPYLHRVTYPAAFFVYVKATVAQEA
jgi:hypothetical protein